MHLVQHSEQPVQAVALDGVGSMHSVSWWHHLHTLTQQLWLPGWLLALLLPVCPALAACPLGNPRHLYLLCGRSSSPAIPCALVVTARGRNNAQNVFWQLS